MTALPVITRLAAELGAEQQGVSKAQQSRPSRGYLALQQQQAAAAAVGKSLPMYW